MRGLKAVENLLQYSLNHNLIEKWDIVLVRNQIYDLLGYMPDEIDDTLFQWTSAKKPKITTQNLPEILVDITEEYIKRGHMPEDTAAARDLFETAVMGHVMPRQSEMIARFYINRSISKEAATEDFYKLCRASNYIRDSKENMYWTAETEYGTIEISINLSHQEKDPKDIVAASLHSAASYPKCPLCLENVGFSGNRTWPASQNLRIIPVTLDGIEWYFQYSPYSQYQEHFVVLNRDHKPMEITAATFRQLVDFVREFPHYFIGSNADLPIVGGSVLSHYHFQGGRHVFPIEKAKPFRHYSHKRYTDVDISLVKWPLSVIRLSVAFDSIKTDLSEKKLAEKNLIKVASEILSAWRKYSNGEIAAYTENVPHNTITPILRLKEGQLELDLILRNNRTSEEHPDGIYHPHKERHHVKKENVELEEVMGLAILPSRLKEEIETGKLSQDSITQTYIEILKDCGVFKDDPKGREDFDTFMTTGVGLTTI